MGVSSGVFQKTGEGIAIFVPADVAAEAKPVVPPTESGMQYKPPKL
jgi:hypothetical protein